MATTLPPPKLLVLGQKLEKSVSSVPKKRKAAPAGHVKNALRILPSESDEDDGCGGGELDADIENDGLGSLVRGDKRIRDRAKSELAAALRNKKTGEPNFPYPPELEEEQQPYWKEIVNSKPHDYWSDSDITLLKMYARSAADTDRLSKEIREEGEVIRNARGNPVVNPKVVVRSFSETRLLALATKLRAQPSSRYDSENDRQQTKKTDRARRSADAILHSTGDEGDSLLAGSSIQ